MKTCTRCKQDKDESEFYRRGKGLRGGCKACDAEANKEWRKNVCKKKYKQITRRANLQKYGITPEQYTEILKGQDYRCKVCGTTESGNRNQKFLVVDHCHETNKVRGLLCHKCNTALGLLGDNILTIMNASKYLWKSYKKED